METSGISTDNKWEWNLDVVLVYETCYDNIWGILSVQGILILPGTFLEHSEHL